MVSRLSVFETQLGWMAILVSDVGLQRLAYAQSSPRAAADACIAGFASRYEEIAVRSKLVQRLQSYAARGNDDLADIEVDSGPLSPFQRKVISNCRKIPCGSTLTYGQLAALAGSPRAARAVGNIMRTNCIPLVIPCHRVVGAGGGLGGYSAPGGLTLKRRLLDLEGCGVGPPRRAK